MKDFYTRLDPRECNLGLDEPVLTSIFGPPTKKPMDELLVGDYVTLSNLERPQQTEEEKDSETTQDSQIEMISQSEEEYIRESDKDRDATKERQIVIKIEPPEQAEHHEGELEPTDFVSVKIEPMDEHVDG